MAIVLKFQVAEVLVAAAKVLGPTPNTQDIAGHGPFVSFCELVGPTRDIAIPDVDIMHACGRRTNFAMLARLAMSLSKAKVSASWTRPRNWELRCQFRSPST